MTNKHFSFKICKNYQCNLKLQYAYKVTLKLLLHILSPRINPIKIIFDPKIRYSKVKIHEKNHQEYLT